MFSIAKLALLFLSLTCPASANSNETSPLKQNRAAMMRAEIKPHANAVIQIRSGGKNFADYKLAFGKTYADESEENHLRENLFHMRVAQVAKHNRRNSAWKMKVNRFADWTDKELGTLRGYKRHDASRFGASLLQEEKRQDETTCLGEEGQACGVGTACCDGLMCGHNGVCTEAKGDLPEHVDHDSLATYNEIADQGQCGGCWAVASAGAIQLQAAFRASRDTSLTQGSSKRTVSLSAQGMLGCTPNPHKCGGTGGCDGSTSELAYAWVMKNGVRAASDEPYTARTHCPDESDSSPAAKIGGFVQIPPNSHAHKIQRALVEIGPLAVAVAAKEWSMYDTGVLHCGADWTIDHAVLAVGYGHENGKKYWKIRNSWGPDWGESGFVRIARRDQDEKHCGTDHNMQEGVACEDDPKEATVCGECGVLSDVTYPTKAHFV